MKKLIALISIAVLIMSMAGCSFIGSPADKTSPTARSMGSIKVMVTDAPARKEVTSIMVSVSAVQVHRAVAQEEQNEGTTTAIQQTQQGDGEWLDIGITGPNPFDLLELRGVEELLAVSQLAPGRYTQIRLAIDRVEVALDGGALTETELPSGELKLVRPFDIIAGEITVILIDFDAQKSVNVTGSDKIIVKPVVKLAISHEKSNEVASASGTLTGVDLTAETISFQATGLTQPLTLETNAQTVIMLDGTAVKLEDLAELPTGTSISVSYYSQSLKAIHIEILTTAAATSV